MNDEGDKAALRAMRRLLGRFGGEGPCEWTFDGKPMTDGIAEPLLILTDEVNSLDAAVSR